MSYKTSIVNISGKKDNDIMLFTLSTCIWCKKTKQLLKDLGLEYNYVDVDLLTGSDQDEAYNEMWKHNQSTSFPTIIINGEKIIIGFDEDELRNLSK